MMEVATMHGMRGFWKLPLVLSFMLALTSCSTTGSMQNMASMTQPQQPHHMQIHHTAHKKTHYTVTHTKSRKVVKHKVTAKQTIPVVHKQPVVATPAKQAKPVIVSKPIQTVPVTPVKTLNKPTKPVKVIAKPEKVTSSKPELVTFSLIFNNKSIKLNPRFTKSIGHKHDIVANLKYNDAMYGQYHSIQVVRWDGTHADEAFVNSKMAIVEALLGLSLLDNSYIESSFGPIIVILGGDAFIINLPGDKLALTLIKAKGGTIAHPTPAHKTPHKKATQNHVGYDPGVPYSQINAELFTDINTISKPRVGGSCVMSSN